MVYKAGKLKGELTTSEIRKLIRAHNVLVSIKIPKGASRDDIIAVLKKNKYKVDHEGGALVPLVEMKRRNKITMTKANEVLPKPKTKEERLEAKATRDKAKATKAKEVLEKESKIKATGVQQGAAIQRLISKKNAPKTKPVLTPIQPVSAAQQKLKKSSDDLKKKWQTFPFTDKQIKKLEKVVPKAKFLNIYKNRKGTPFGLAVDGIKYKFNKPLEDDTVSNSEEKSALKKTTVSESKEATYKIFLKLLKELTTKFDKLSKADGLKKYTTEGEIRRPFYQFMGDAIFRYRDNTETQFNNRTDKGKKTLLRLMNEALELIKAQPSAQPPKSI